MPELAEVEFARKLLEHVAVGRRIVEVEADEDDIVLDKVSPAELTERLRGRTVMSTHRHGKYMWLALDARPWPVFHFGMTGAFRLPDDQPLMLESSPKNVDRSWPPRFTKLLLTLDDGQAIAFINSRRLGRVRLREDPEHEPPIKSLGFDPFTGLLRPKPFREKLRRRKGPMKAILLDQSFAAGVGNWIADEVLYQARIDPRRTPTELTDDDIERIRKKLSLIVKTAVKVDADKSRFPRTWLFHKRWGKGKKVAPRMGKAKIEFIEVGGRTTAFCPERQK